MARLNEDAQALPYDAFETLKRRFLRQNRELAKANSNQSIRVRLLEAEAAKLLSDNITLKESNHQLECELARYREKYPPHVQKIHHELEAKVAELAATLRGLDGAFSRQGRQPPTPERTKLIRPTDERPWRAARSEIESPQRLNDNLPTLAEESEISQSLSNTWVSRQVSELPAENSSPDIGPPPVAHFDSEDIRDVVDVPNVLKSRRKKRESLDQEAIRRAIPTVRSSEQRKDSAAKPTSIPSPSRSNLKRKLSNADEDLQVKDNASFSVARDQNGAQSDTKAKALAFMKVERERRKALAPKHTNSDLSSPQKSRGKELRGKDEKKAPAPLKPSRRESFSTLEPETPFTTDIISPLSSQPSSEQQGLCSTPPPQDLAGRIGRRARSNVSYAEPNLRDKMRRPTKELVDAVTGEGKQKRLSTTTLDREPLDRPLPDSNNIKPPTLSTKENQEQAFRAGATSPLQDKASSSTTDSRPPPPSTTLKRPKSSSQVKGSTSLAAAIQSLDIFDVDSAPHGSMKGETRARQEELARRREGRRRESSAFKGIAVFEEGKSSSPESDEEARRGRRQSSSVLARSGKAGGSSSRSAQNARDSDGDADGQDEKVSRSVARRRSMIV